MEADKGPPKMALGKQEIRTTNKFSWSVFSVLWTRSLGPAAGPKGQVVHARLGVVMLELG